MELPLELIDFIYHYIDHPHLLRLARVGGIITHALGLWRKLDLECYWPGDFPFIAKVFTSLFELKIHHIHGSISKGIVCPYGGGLSGSTYRLIPVTQYDDYLTLASLPTLRKLDFSEAHINNAILQAICRGPSRTSLLELSFSCYDNEFDDEEIEEITEVGFDALLKLTTLRKLHIRYTKIDGCSLKKICESHLASTLLELDLNGCHHLRRDDFNLLGLLSVLQTLNVSDTIFGDDALETICNGRAKHTLKSLTMINCVWISDSGLTNLTSLPQLQVLNINGYDGYINGPGRGKVTGDTIASLSQLRELGLGSTRIDDDDDLKKICEGNSRTVLEKVDLCFCSDISENGYGALASLTNLQTLLMRRCTIGDDALKTVCEGPASLTLKYLSIPDCRKLSSGAFSTLSLLSSLQQLDVSKTKIGDDAIRDICYGPSSTTLENINIRGCENISLSGISHLDNLSEHCQVKVDWKFNTYKSSVKLL